MKALWPLQDAKNRLSELVDQAVRLGPQTITRRGKKAAVVISIADFKKLVATRGDLVSFFRKSPLAAVELDLERAEDYGREIPL